MICGNCSQAQEEASAAWVPWSDMFSRKFRKVVGLATGLVALQQLSGINVIVYYSTEARPHFFPASDPPMAPTLLLCPARDHCMTFVSSVV